MKLVHAAQCVGPARHHGRAGVDLERHLRGDASRRCNTAIDGQPRKRWQATRTNKRFEQDRRVGEPPIDPGRLGRRRCGELDRIANPRAHQFDVVVRLRHALAKVGAAGPPHQPVVRLSRPRRERHAQPLEPDRVDLCLEVTHRIDEHDPLACRIVEHDFSSGLRAAALGRGGLEEVPGDTIAKQRQAACHRLHSAVDEDLALHAKPGVLGGPHRHRDRGGHQPRRQKQPHGGPQRHGSQGFGLHGRSTLGFPQAL